MSKVGKITEELKARVLEENDLIEVAKDYGIEIGENGKGKCPFHNDGNKGNLHFFEKKGELTTYFCFSKKCSAGKIWKDKEKTQKHILKLPNGVEIEDGGSDVIGFVMNIEQVPYYEAVRILCERAGIPVPTSRENHRTVKAKKERTTRNLNYYKALKANDDMMEYLENRGVNKESIKKWRLGYIPEGKSHAPFSEKIENRLVFGLTERAWNPLKAKTIAMAYRAMSPEQEKYAKYLNDYNDYDPNDEKQVREKGTLYHKSFYLYGINEARKAIRHQRCAIVTEGYFDTIIAHQSGLENTVATCGTAFTQEQMKILRSLTDTLIFWYDGDGSGMDAMLESVDELFEMGFRVKIVDSAPYDPADLMNELGQDKERILKFLQKRSKSALQVLAESVFDDYDSQMTTAQTEALDELMPILESIQDPIEKMIFKSNIQKRLGVVL